MLKSRQSIRFSEFAFGLTLLGIVALAAITRVTPATTGVIESGCSTLSVNSITEDSSFTAYDDRLTHPQQRPIKDPTLTAVRPNTGYRGAPPALDAMQEQWAATLKDGSSVTFYFPSSMADGLVADEFFARGGVMFKSEPTDEKAELYIASLKQQFGGRVVVVPVGSYAAALTWADPLANGVRTHHLVWLDDTTMFTLVAEREPHSIVNIARNIVC